MNGGKHLNNSCDLKLLVKKKELTIENPTCLSYINH